MNAESNPNVSARVRGLLRSFLASISRELQEHRSLYFAPLIAAALLLITYALLFLRALPRLSNTLRLEGDAPAGVLIGYTAPIYGAVLVTVSLACLFYSLDALYGERRDRSILFWKSLPVSDTHAVLAKFAVPTLAVIPIQLAIIFVAQFVILVIISIIALIHGKPLTFFAENAPLLPFVRNIVYGSVTSALWYAPIFAVLLFVSSFANRAPLMWVAVPLIAIVAFEKLALKTNHIGDALHRRLFGGDEFAFSRATELGTLGDDHPLKVLEHVTEGVTRIAPDPVKFFSSGELWIGFAITAVFLFAAIKMRRYRSAL